MSDLPAPLVPAEVDLRDFQFTPIYRGRLFGSSFHARVSDAAWRAGVTLWLKSWDQMPAGTLPDDEVELCRLAELGRDVRGWRKIAREALHGWFKCSDGRMHHKTVAEGVMEGWNRKLAQRSRTEEARKAKLAKRQSQAAEAAPTKTGEPSVTASVTAPVADPVTETVTGSKGQGQGQGQLKEESPKRAPPDRTRKAYTEDFERFWSAYPTDPNMSKSKAGEAWGRLSDVDRLSAGAAVPGFRAHCRKDPTYRPVHAVRFITERRFDGFLTAKAATADFAEVPRVDLGPGGIVPEALVVDVIRRGGWIDQWGPRIGKPGCRVPDRIIELARGVAA